MSTTVTVHNVAPSSVVTPDVEDIDEGSAATLTGTYMDATNADTHELYVRWGDGSEETVSVPSEGDATSSPGRAFTRTHVYEQNGEYTIVSRIM